MSLCLEILRRKINWLIHAIKSIVIGKPDEKHDKELHHCEHHMVYGKLVYGRHPKYSSLKRDLTTGEKIKMLDEANAYCTSLSKIYRP